MNLRTNMAACSRLSPPNLFCTYFLHSSSEALILGCFVHAISRRSRKLCNSLALSRGCEQNTNTHIALAATHLLPTNADTHITLNVSENTAKNMSTSFEILPWAHMSSPRLCAPPPLTATSEHGSGAPQSCFLSTKNPDRHTVTPAFGRYTFEHCCLGSKKSKEKDWQSFPWVQQLCTKEFEWLFESTV